jgi:uncharacterized protein with HEPN domain
VSVPARSERLYLSDARDAIDRVLSYTSDGRDRFFNESMVQDAVVRNLEIIGEAVKHLSPATRAKRADIPWSAIARMRDRLIHDYFHVDLNIAWDVVENDLMPLREALIGLLED